MLGTETFSAPGAPSGALGWLAVMCSKRSTVRVTRTVRFAVVTAARSWRRWRSSRSRARRNASELLAFGAGLTGGGDDAEQPARRRRRDRVAGRGGDSCSLVDASTARAALRRGAVAIVWCNLSPAGLFAPCHCARLRDRAASRSFRRSGARRFPWLVLGGTLLAAFLTPGGLQFIALVAGCVAFRWTAVRATVRRGAARLQTGGSRPRSCDDVSRPARSARSRHPDMPVRVDRGLDERTDTSALRNRCGTGHRGGRATNVSQQDIARPGTRSPSRSSSCSAEGGWSAAEANAAESRRNDLVARLRADGRVHRVFCPRLDWCGLTVAAGDPQLRVFMDEREAAYPPSVRARANG